MKINLSKISAGILDCLKRFPAEALLGVFFLVLYTIQDHLTYSDPWNKEIGNVLPLFPAFYILTYSLNLLCRNKTRILYWLSPFCFIPFLVWVDLEHFTFSIAYAFTLVLSLFILLACKCKWNNRDFADFSVQTFVDMVIACFIGHVLSLAILAIYASIVYIFDFDWGRLMLYMYMFILFVFTPLMFCHLQDKKTGYTLPRFMEIIINYILAPGVVIYTGILYLYIVMIVIRWELPKGGIGYMVLAFIAAAMAGRMAQLITKKHPFAWFYDRFSWIALPPLALFWFGCIERISTYSLTESRVYLLASGILTTMYVLFLFSKRLGTYQLMALISAGCIVVLTFVPGISAKQIGIQAQTKRLEQYIRQLDMRNDSTQKLKTHIVVVESEDSVKAKEYRELREAYYYLRNEQGFDYMEEKYGPCTITINSLNSYRQLNLGLTQEVDIQSYSRFVNLQHHDKQFQSKVENGILTLRRRSDDKVIVKYNIDEYMNTHVEQMAGFDDYATISTEPLVYHNDSCMLLINYLSYHLKDGKFYCSSAYDISLFIK